MSRNPVQLYTELLERAGTALGLEDAGETRSRLYTFLKPDRLTDQPLLEAVLDDLAISPGYARNHLLSIGGWPQDVVEAITEGLPLAAGRALAQHGEAVRASAFRLAEQFEEGTHGQRIVRALGQLDRDDADDTEYRLKDGWLPPVESIEGAIQSPTGDVWRYPSLGPAGRALEELHPFAVHAVLDRYASSGSKIVDLTAGSGTVARVAVRRGCWVWSGDISPRHEFIHQIDATTDDALRLLSDACADVVFLHPPSYFAWQKDRPHGSVEGREGYAELISNMIVNAFPLIRAEGHLVLVSRPVRTATLVHTAMGELPRELEDAALALVGYHLAVDDSGSDDWHILVGRRLVE